MTTPATVLPPASPKSPTGPADVSAAAAAAAAKGGNMNLFVANLSNDVSDEMLHAAFAPHGKILTCKVMLDIHTGISRGFGFVLFESAEEGARAMTALHGIQLGQKQIYVSVAMTNGLSGLQQTPKLYVRNVPKALSLDFLRSHFSQFGEIVRINFRDDQTQTNAPPEHRAYLATTTIIFLEYKTPAQAEAAVRVTHNSRPWPQHAMEIPLLAKPAETSQMRNERRQRQASKTSSTGSPGQSTGSQPRGSTSSFGMSGGSLGGSLPATEASPVPMPGVLNFTSGPQPAAPPIMIPALSSLPPGQLGSGANLPFYYVPMPQQGVTMISPPGLNGAQAFGLNPDGTLSWTPQQVIMLPRGAAPLMMQMPQPHP